MGGRAGFASGRPGTTRGMEHADEVLISPSLGQEVLLGEATDDATLRIEVKQEPGVAVPPHVHPLQEERIEVIDGELSLRVGLRRFRLAAGETTKVPAGHAHSLTAAGGQPARLVAEFRPALDTAACLRETYAIDQAALGAAPRLRALARTASRYPREFLFYVPLIPWQLQQRALTTLDAALGAAGASGDGLEASAVKDGATRWLAIYMNDQLAAGVLWREVARRAARANARGEIGETLSSLAQAISDDVDTIEQIMVSLGIPRSRLKPALALAAERLGRLKLNGRLRGYSPLSRFVELDFLAVGVEGKKRLWATLRELAGLDGRLPDVDFDALIERAQSQLELIEPLHRRAGSAALSRAERGDGERPSRSDQPRPPGRAEPARAEGAAVHRGEWADRSHPGSEPPEVQREPDTLLERETNAAARQAGRIGGRVPRSSQDPGLDPVYQAGGGEQEGWEAAESDLIENATHGEGRANPMRDEITPERESDRSSAVEGEADGMPPIEGS